MCNHLKPSTHLSVSASSWWLASALVLSTATLYRIPALPLGIGETMLLLWLLGSLPRLRLHATGASAPLVLVTVLAASIFSVLLIVGAALAFGRGDLGGVALHTLSAIVFCCGLLAMFCLQEQFEQRAQELAIALSVVTATLVAALFLFAQLPRLLIGEYTIFYYGGVRFSALAANPNQFAFLMVGLPFLAASWLPPMPRSRRESIMLASLVLSCIGGLASLSNALRGAWMLSAAIGVVGLFVSQNWRNRRSGILTYVCIIGLAFALHFAGGLWPTVPPLDAVPSRQPSGQGTDTGNALVEKSRDFLRTLPQAQVDEWRSDGTGERLSRRADAALQAFEASHVEENQLSERRTLWRNGLEAIKRAPVLGNGPGHFSGFNGPFEGKEAHNTLIDWTASTGVIGLIVLVTWAGYVAWWLWRGKNWVGLGGFVALVFLAQFHFVMRQPIFWFALLTLAALSTKDVRSMADGKET